MLVAIVSKNCIGEQVSPQTGKKEKVYAYGVLTTKDCNTSAVALMTEQDLVAEIYRGKHRLVNASIENGKIVEDMGSLDRLKIKNGVAPHVILATYVSISGKLTGYVLATPAGDPNNIQSKVIRVKTDVFMKKCKEAKEKGVSLVQNGIYREVDGVSSVACYPHKPFYVIKQKLANKPKEVHSQVDIKKNKENLEKKRETKYSPEQRAELQYAQNNGVDPIIIANPKLTPEQMRVLWTAKRNKRCVEYFANPKFSDKQMQFLSERLTDKQVFTDCKVMINPKYSVDQMTELYLGCSEGLDCSSFANPDISAEKMRIERMKLENEFFSDVSLGGIYSKGTDEENILSFISSNLK